jgi:hypothetical protein
VRRTPGGRWVPARPPKPEPREPTALENMQAICRAGLAAGAEMPWWYPLMSFEAAVGRASLRDQT